MTAYNDHYTRVKAAVEGVYGLTTLDEYISNKTYLNGKLYSFDGHEFQKDISQSTAKEDITVKIAQVGVSEFYYRWALAACRNIENFTVIYTFPNASDASQTCTTRINPIINDSPDLRMQVNANVNNSELKQFGKNSFFYMRGTRSEQGAISIPADCIINDEWDKSDIDVATMYVARLQHKPYKLIKKFSTPTIDKYGILKEAETAKRKKHLVKCQCCNHFWLPNYFSDVKIPQYTGDLRDITKVNLKNIKWEQAQLLCPKCGRDPQLTAETIHWVIENPDDNYHATARFISPFSASKIITMPYLVQSSTLYKKYSEFMNQGLGLAAEEPDDTITEADLEACFPQADFITSDVHVFASDMGIKCRCMIGRQAPDGTIIVVHMEEIPLGNFENRRRELIQQFNCILSVHDTQPYVDLIMRITEQDSNAYGSIFTTFKAGPIFRVQTQDEDVEEGKLNLRQIKIRRNEALDEVFHIIKDKKLMIQPSDLKDEFKVQLQSLKKIQKFDNNKELIYVWDKAGDANDHFHFALLYLYTGLTLRGMSIATASAVGTLPLLSVVKKALPLEPGNPFGIKISTLFPGFRR